MVIYKCFNCGAKVKPEDLKNRFVCPECNTKIFFKPRNKMKTVKAI